jgi:hypothetical protein
MFYYLYKITNTVNNKIYIGVHQTEDIDDGYMGSGKILTAAIKKYGIENFTKEILEVFNDAQSMFNREKEIVTEDFVARDDVYNIKVGGFGGWDYVNRMNLRVPIGLTEQGRQKCSQAGQRSRDQKFGLFSLSKEELEAASLKGRSKVLEKYPQGTFKGRLHTEESKNKIKQSIKGKQVGERNSQFGKRWIHNLEIKKSMKIAKSDPLPPGWHEGRKMRF